VRRFHAVLIVLVAAAILATACALFDCEDSGIGTDLANEVLWKQGSD
jgi:hypothetical protein